MREKLNTLPLSELKELARTRGLRGISGLRKAELIDVLCRLDEEKQPADRESAAPEPAAAEMAAAPSAGSASFRQENGGAEEKAAPAAEPEREKSAAIQGSGGPFRGTGEPSRHDVSSGEGRTRIVMRRREENSGIRENGNGRQDRSHGDGRNGRTNGRYENRNGYSGRGRSQDNNGRNDYSRNGENGRSQDYGRNGESGRGQDYGRNGENGRGTDGFHAQDTSRRDYEQNRNPDQRRENENIRNGEVSGQENAASSVGMTGRISYGIREGARPDGRNAEMTPDEIQELDSGLEANGILEVMPDGFGFIRCENFLPGENDVYVAPSQIRRFNMKTGDIIRGNRRVKAATEKFAALLYVTSINGYPAGVAERRPNFEDLTPVFPNQRLHMETGYGGNSVAMRVLDLMAPIGKGQRGMIVSPPKAGKTTLLKQVAKAITTNHPDMHLIILLIDERPEEVTDIKEAIVGENVEVIYSTFDELPERHKRVSEMVIERARRLVEHGRDVTILLDSITRLARAYNLVVPPSGRTLSGGLDPAALHMPKRFFGAARNTREGGSLTILATALIDTGSRMDDVIYEEFKGTGNMELVLDRKLSERRIFPAIDVLKSGTRRDDLLLSREEAEAVEIIRRATNSMKPEDSVEKLIDLFARTRSNQELVNEIRRRRYL